MPYLLLVYLYPVRHVLAEGNLMLLKYLSFILLLGLLILFDCQLNLVYLLLLSF